MNKNIKRKPNQIANASPGARALDEMGNLQTALAVVSAYIQAKGEDTYSGFSEDQLEEARTALEGLEPTLPEVTISAKGGHIENHRSLNVRFGDNRHEVYPENVATVLDLEFETAMAPHLADLRRRLSGLLAICVKKKVMGDLIEETGFSLALIRRG